MAVPGFQDMMLPILQIAEDGKEHSFRETTEAVADRLGLTEADRKELLPSGRQTTLATRTYMAKAGLLATTRRGCFRITDRGREVLGQQPAAIDTAYLEQFAEFREFKALRRDRDPGDGPDTILDSRTPEELIEAAHKTLRDSLAAELLQEIQRCSPSFFERLVVDLLVRMGYGGTHEDAGRAIGQSHDGGVDGIIKEDRLGLDVVYVQAKRWDLAATVGRPEIQKFAGALQGHRARKGVFITTSSFSRDALDYVSRIDSKIVLIDGQTLVRMMIDFGVGVTPVGSYEVKRIDSDYFSEG
jgi:restriction system protein